MGEAHGDGAPDRRPVRGIAFAYMKRNLHAAETEPLQTVLDMEALGQARTGTTEDHREAAQAFVEKRSPVFRGR